jgi:FMN reductase
MKMTVVVGNPKPKSRTRDAAERIAAALADGPASLVIDVVDLGPGLLQWGAPAIAEAIRAVLDSEAVIVASPTFKATYTGLLKLFLDQFPAGALADRVAFPVMLGSAPQHALAPELLLKPVLVELGATCPAPGLYLLDSDYEAPAVLADWLPRAQSALRLLTSRGEAHG